MKLKCLFKGHIWKGLSMHEQEVYRKPDVLEHVRGEIRIRTGSLLTVLRKCERCDKCETLNLTDASKPDSVDSFSTQTKS